MSGHDGILVCVGVLGSCLAIFLIVAWSDDK